MDAVHATGMLQRFTIRFSHQPDTKLGLVLVDDDPLVDFDGDFDWVDSDDDGCSFIRGERGQSLLQSASARQSPQKSNTGASITSSGVKRNRPTNVRISGFSYAFTFANKLRDAAEKFFPESRELENEKSDPQLMEGNLDELVEWGRTNLPSTMLSNGDPFCLDDVNEASIKYVVTGAIKPGDTVEKVQFSSHSKGSRKRKKTVPHFRSDHFKTVRLENKHNSIEILKKILSVELHYPLYITLKRWVRPDNANNSQMCDYLSSRTHSQSNGCGPPVQNRIKRGNPRALSTAGHPSSTDGDEKKAQESVDEEGFISLLDSPDEEEMDDKGPLIDTNPRTIKISQTQPDGGPNYSSLIHINVDHPPPRRISPLRRQAVPPDPSLLPLHDHEFVLTPYGPGKILSWRVERHAFSKLSFGSSLDKDAAGSIFNPIIICSIDLHFGTCHIPSDQIKSISECMEEKRKCQRDKQILEASLRRIKAELETSKKSNENLATQNSNLGVSNSALAAELSRLKSDNQNMRSIKLEQEEELEAVERAFHSEATKNERLGVVEGANESILPTINQLDAENQQLKEKAEQHDSEMKALRASIEKVQTEKQEMAVSKNKIQEDLDDIRDKYQSLQAKNDNLTAQVDKLTSDANEFQHKKRQAIRALTDEYSTLDDQYNKLVAKMNELNEENKELKSELGERKRKRSE